MNIENIKNDLAVFADLGTGPPQITSSFEGRSLVRMFRGGEELEIELPDSVEGRIVERTLGSNDERTHATYRALLASDKFGNLRKWADSQKILLEEVAEGSENRLRVWGRLAENGDAIGPEDFDNNLIKESIGFDEVKIMLIDGPAGIGKTRFIEILAYQRAKRFWNQQRPLILHVESRGRVLTFIQDLIAFSLQRMRLSVTFDQVPILVRNGLITLAIDGFDELGDPSGYEHAWGQLNELISQVRGGGTVILAGRDTFIGSERIRRDIKSLRESDAVDALSLQPPLPEDARNWLRGHGWSKGDIDSVDELFEVGSYALRPFFLTQLADKDVASAIRDKAAGTPLAFLVDLMISREVGKFGDAIDGVINEEQRHWFVRRFLREVARFMAEDQAEAIDEVALAWIVEVVAPEKLGSESLNLLKNRAGVVAFLAKDSARNHRRFAHSQLFNHFLGEETIDAVGNMEVPKYLRRNILAADFLAAFGDLVLHTIHINQSERITKFCRSAAKLVEGYESYDRGPRNLGALLVTMLPAFEYLDEISSLGPLHMDEALIKEGTIAATTLDRVVINQLDIRGSDIRQLVFKECVIVTLIGNDATRLCLDFPTPSRIQYESPSVQKTIIEPEDIEEWIAKRQGKGLGDDAPKGKQPVDYEHPLVKLLERACRNRSYWIKQSDDDVIAARLVKDPKWEDLVTLLRQHDLVREGQKQSGGQSAQFLHIKRPMDILMRVADDPQIEGFYHSLEEAIGA